MSKYPTTTAATVTAEIDYALKTLYAKEQSNESFTNPTTTQSYNC
jgi:hypothetical protein